ncbi:MAG: DUF4984 domain-containing protein [Candidatus Cryptobacteroides sp.]
MKKIYIIGLAAAAIAALSGCQEKFTTYSGPSYIAFSDTLNICPVQQGGEAFDVMIASTRATGHDRTFAVEVIDSESNAVFGHHYTIPSQTVVIPAGERSTSLRIIGNYDAVESGDSLSITLSLVAADDEKWDLYGQKTRVLLKKVCPFDINNFAGHCVVTSSFWLYYNSSNLERLTTSEVVADEENTILIKDFLMEGYDLKLRLDNSDILNPTVSLGEEQIVGDTRIAFSYIYGDGLMRMVDAPITNYLFPCDNYLVIYTTLYVKEVGTVGTFVNIVEWISDEDAELYEKY